MPIGSKSREVVRLERARASAELSKACSRDVERLRATLPRGGGMDAAIENRQIECTPRTMTLGFREKLDQLDQLVREQRQELVLAMKRMERDRAFPRKAAVATNVYNVTGPNARVNINSTDASVNVVNVETTQLFGELRAAINREIAAGDKRDELLRGVDSMEKAQRTPGFLQRYQGFVAALADHITLFQAFLPALLQLIG